MYWNLGIPGDALKEGPTEYTVVIDGKGPSENWTAPLRHQPKRLREGRDDCSRNPLRYYGEY